MRKLKVLIVIFVLLLLVFPNINYASDEESEKNGYKIIIEDDADLLTDDEETSLREYMEPITEFGSVMFKTIDSNGYNNTATYAETYYHRKLGNQTNGVLFLIDIDMRKIWIFADGEIYNTITVSKSNTITDNIYKLATNKEYYECAKKAFIQINDLLNGRKIAESMKYICNALLSVMISLFLSYGLYSLITKNKKASNSDIINECSVSLVNSEVIIKHSGTHREYSPRSSGSSGGGRRRSAVAVLPEAEEVIVSKKMIYCKEKYNERIRRM